MTESLSVQRRRPVVEGVTNGVRVLAICVFRDADRILVAHGFDVAKGEHFVRPLGGQVEFGERAADAVRREIREELQAEIDQAQLLGVLENLFVYGGAPGHEIVFVFDAKFREPSFYRQKEIPIAEDVWLGPATWESLSTLSSGGTSLYPEGLLSLLLAQSSSEPS